MKVKKLVLDESLLDTFDSNELIGDRWVERPEFGPGLMGLQSKGLIDTYDDDFSDPEGFPSTEDPHLEEPLPGPQTGVASGIAGMLIDAINDEWSTIDKYNSIIQTLRSTPEIINPEGFIKVLEEINAEENRHAGQLQELLKQISPNAAEVTEGQKEAKKQLNQFVNGRLQVQSWDTPTPTPFEDGSNELCSLSDIDDEM